MSSEFAFLLENSRVYVDYQITESVAGQEIIFLRFERPAEVCGECQFTALPICRVTLMRG